MDPSLFANYSFIILLMMRAHNFSAGPATLPEEVLMQAAAELPEYRGTGMSLIESSHRSKAYDEVHTQAIDRIKSLLGITDSHEVLLLGGGATMQFGMVPLNLLPGGSFCDFTVSGAWAEKALDDAKKIGAVKVVFDGESSSYTTLPNPYELETHADAAYLHLTSNETINGLQWRDFPDTQDVPIVADMSSDIMSRPLPMDRFGVIYAGAQKNLGPSGVTVVIIRRDLLPKCNADLPAYLTYPTHASKQSLYNTPPVFPIYLMNLVLGWVGAQGGVAAMQDASQVKSDLIYSIIDESEGFYRCPVDSSCRSRMNVVFNLKSTDLEAAFLKKAGDAGMVGLKGHRSVGGIRASLYNALPMAAVNDLAAFMKGFAADHG